jgi:GNAT superfamily N-acetyltransferase
VAERYGKEDQVGAGEGVIDHVRIIPADKRHLNLIRSSFVKEYSRIHHIPPAVAYSKLDTLMHAWTVVVAVTDVSDDEVLGWVLYKNSSMIGWLYVKPIYRRHGVCRHLLSSLGVVSGAVDVAFFSLHAAKLAKEKGLAIRWRPYQPDTEAESWSNVVRMIETAWHDDENSSSGTLGALPEREIAE